MLKDDKAIELVNNELDVTLSYSVSEAITSDIEKGENQA